MSRFIRRHLDPTSRLGEILFGLIMVLTVTHDVKDVNRNDTLEFTREADTPGAKQALANGLMAEVHGQS